MIFQEKHPDTGETVWGCPRLSSHGAGWLIDWFRADGGDKANALELPAANLPLCRGRAKKIHVGEFLKNGGTLRAKVNRFCKLLEGTVKPDFKGAWLDFKPLGE